MKCLIVQAWPACLFAFAIYQEVRSNAFDVFGFYLTMWMLQELCCAGVCVSLFRWVDFLCFGERIVCLMVTCLEGW